MYGLYLEVYIAFLSIVFLFLLANAVLPRKRRVYKAMNYRPKTLVIVPCKGTDIGLVQNFKAVKGQRYNNYDVIAVVDSKDDPAVRAIKESKTRFMVSDYRCSGCSGKVRAICKRTFQIQGFYDAYVILDSDVRVKDTWLADLIAPLAYDTFGISTAFPVFEPVGGFWSKVKHAWGYVGHSMMENEVTRFGWGGSLAFRKGLLSDKEFAYFSRSISDDIALTKIAKQKHLKVAYVSDANPVVQTDDTFGTFLEWSNRQTALSISGNRKIMYYGTIYYLSSVLLLVSGILLALFVNVLFGLLLLPFVIGALKLYYRSGFKPYMLGIYFAMDFIYLFNIIIASQMSSIAWRGRVYEITETNEKAL